MGFTSFLSKLVTHTVLWGLVAVTYLFKDALAFNLAVFLASFAAGLSIAKFFFGGGVKSFDLATSVFGKVVDAIFLLSAIALVITFATNAFYVPATLLAIALVIRIAAYEQAKSAAQDPGTQSLNLPTLANLTAEIEKSTLASELSARLDAAVVAAQTKANSAEVPVSVVAAVDPAPAVVNPVPVVVEPVAAVVVAEPTPTPVAPVPEVVPAAPALTLEQQVADLTKKFSDYVANAEAKLAAAV